MPANALGGVERSRDKSRHYNGSDRCEKDCQHKQLFGLLGFSTLYVSGHIRQSEASALQEITLWNSQADYTAFA